MKICKRIITSFVALVTCFSLCATPVLAAWQNELGHWYVNSNFAQWAVGGILSYAGSALGGMAGTIVLPGGGTIEGTALGATAGAAASVGILDLASYYAAGYTDDDYYTAEDSYVSTLDRTTASSSVVVTGFSSDYVHSYKDYSNYIRSAFSYIGYYYPDEYMSLFRFLGLNDKVMVMGQDSSGNLCGIYFDETGLLRYSLFSSIMGKVHASHFGVYSLSDLTYISDAYFLWAGGSNFWTVTNYTNPVYYSKVYAELALGNDFATTTCYAIDWSTKPITYGNSSYDAYYLRIPCFSKLSSDSDWSTSYTYFTPNFECSYLFFPDEIMWNNSHVVTQPSGTDSSTRTASLMQTINNYNIDNSYTDNSTVVNYFIGSLADDGSVSDIYAPNLFDEDTMIFTDPETGTEYQAAGWLYNYETRTYGIAFDSGVLTVNDTGVDYVRLTYGDNAVTVEYFQGDAETLVSSSTYAYVMASQSACNINGHSYSVETIKEPTCIASGERTYTCSVCGNQYVEEISKTDHTYTDYTITQEPTCTAGGIASYTCSTCGAQITEKLDALGHDWLASEVTETTYEVPEGTSCSDCSGTTFTHTRSDTTFTCTCSDCGAEWTVEADVTYGSTTYTCSRCGESYVEQDGKGLSEGLGDAIKSFAKKAWSAIASGIGKLFSGFANLLSGIFGFFTDTVVGGIKNFFSTLSDDSILGYYQDDTGTATLPEGLTSAMSMIPAFFGGLPAELQAPVIFGIAALFLIAALKLFL